MENGVISVWDEQLQAVKEIELEMGNRVQVESGVSIKYE